MRWNENLILKSDGNGTKMSGAGNRNRKGIGMKNNKPLSINFQINENLFAQLSISICGTVRRVACSSAGAYTTPLLISKPLVTSS